MRTDTLFGKNVNVVGDISADLVLESLGKIYVKSRNKAQTLDEIIKSLGASSTEQLAQKTIIIDSLDQLDDMILKDGALVYDKSSKTLYIQIEGELVELISVATNDTRYVKKTGDSMTGQLKISVPAGKSPLVVNTAVLNKNLNAQYLNGIPSSAFAQKGKNENITGSWLFSNNTYHKSPVYFQDSTMHYKDSIHAGSVGTPNFMSGFGGYGWRIDAKTNTLTIDYIVVRKAMYIYELVVNKISATNGSLWVSNASKVKVVCKLDLITGTDSQFNSWFTQPGQYTGEGSTQESRNIATFLTGMENNQGFIISNAQPPIISITAAELSSNENLGQGGDFFNFKNLKVIMCTDQVEARNVATNDSSFSFKQSQCSYEGVITDSHSSQCFRMYNLFNKYFDTNVVFPIVHLNDIDYKFNSSGLSTNTVYGDPIYVKTYYKYFGQRVTNYLNLLSTNFYLVQFDTDNLPVFQPGDLLRCQKFTGNGIKYYDAVVCNKLNDSYFIIQLGSSIMDKTTTIVYDDNLNPTTTEEVSSINADFYDTTGHRSNDILGIVQEGDDLVQIGHLWDINRQNSLYLTSSDDGAPFIDTMSQVNRPDYSVIYYTPNFETIKLYKGGDLPFTGNYYIQNDEGIITGQYGIAYSEDNFYSVLLNKPNTDIILWYKDRNGNVLTIPFDDIEANPDSEWILSHRVRLQEIETGTTENTGVRTIQRVKELIIAKYNLQNLDDYTVLVLRGYPDQYSKLEKTSSPENLTTESGENIVTESEEVFILEDTHDKPGIVSTRTTKARLGRLDGIIDERFGPQKQPCGYGLYGENVYLTGEFILSNGKNVIDFDKDIISLQSGLEMNSKAYQNMIDALKSLSDNTPSYGNLEAAGVFLTQNKLILYGDSIMVITDRNELGGTEAPTALFSDGKINARFISTQVIRSNIPLYAQGGVPSSYIYIDTQYIGESMVYEYRQPVGNSYETHYIRKYEGNSKECWIYTDIKGNPIYQDSYSYIASSCQPIDSVSAQEQPGIAYEDSPMYVNYGGTIYEKVKSTTYSFVQYTSEGTTYTWNPDSEKGTVYTTFQNELLDIVLWSLNIDGTGNLGGSGIFWNNDSTLTVSGIINASGGRIGNISIKNDCLYKNVYNGAETLTNFYLGGNEGQERLEFTKYQYNSCNASSITSRTLLNSSMLEITNKKSMEASNNGVQLTPEGLVWKYDEMPLTASSILFTITVIPIRDSRGLYLPYVKANYATIQEYRPTIGNISISPFEYINIYAFYPDDAGHAAGNGGEYIVYFPKLDDATKRANTQEFRWGSWMHDMVQNGRVIFQVTGLGEYDTNISFNDHGTYNQCINSNGAYLEFYNNNLEPTKACIQSYSFGAGRTGLTHDRLPNHLSLDIIKRLNVCYFSRPYRTYSGIQSSDVNERGNRLMYSTKSILNTVVNNTKTLWSQYYDSNTKTDLQNLSLFGPYYDDGDSPTPDAFGSYSNESESDFSNTNLIRGLTNYIRLSTSDDSSLNRGGFTLTAFYLSGLNVNNSTLTSTVQT